jgi:nucleoside-diphosphate-sugar epimerase
MKVTITGAAGRLGSALVRLLTEHGHAVTATDALYRADLPVRIQVANLLDPTCCYRLLEDSEAVVHLANYTGVVAGNATRTLNENTAVNMNIFEAARQVGVQKIIYASSIQAIYGSRPPDAPLQFTNLPYLPLDSAVPAHPGNAYALSKVVAEHMLEYFARQYGLSCIAVRFPLMLDAAQTSPWRKFLRDNFPAHHNPDEAGAYLYFPDAAALVEAVLRAPLPGYRTYLPAAADHLTGRPVAEVIQKCYPTVPLRRSVAEITSLVDISQIERETSWQPAPATCGA